MNVGEALAAARAAQARERPETRRQRSQKFYASQSWRRLRFRILAENAERNGGAPKCELCGAGRRDGEALHVDHVTPLSIDWSRRLDPTNLQVLCASCNMGKVNKSTVDFRPAAEPEPSPESSAPSPSAAE